MPATVAPRIAGYLIGKIAQRATLPSMGLSPIAVFLMRISPSLGTGIWMVWSSSGALAAGRIAAVLDIVECGIVGCLWDSRMLMGCFLFGFDIVRGVLEAYIYTYEI